MRYFFDTRDNGTFIRDDQGIECDNFEVVKDEAARGLADLVLEVLPGSVRRKLSIEVREESGRMVLITGIVIEVLVLVEGDGAPVD
jgi:hypothetical protein